MEKLLQNTLELLYLLELEKEENEDYKIELYKSYIKENKKYLPKYIIQVIEDNFYDIDSIKFHLNNFVKILFQLID